MRMIIIQITEEQLQNSMKAAAQQAIEAALKQTMNLTDDLLSRRETAKYLGASLPTLNAWEKTGKLKAVRFGSRVYFRKSDLLNSMNVNHKAPKGND